MLDLAKCVHQHCVPTQFMTGGRVKALLAAAGLLTLVLLRVLFVDTLIWNIGDEGLKRKLSTLDQFSETLVESIKNHLERSSNAHYSLYSGEPLDRSQNGQSCVVASLFGDQPHNLTFLEAGAYNGEDLSNSLYLERQLGWRGLLVEPDPWNYWSLRRRNRKAATLNACLSPYTFSSELILKQSDTMSRLAISVDVTKERGIFTRVLCYPLYTVLLAAGLTRLNYLALDIEGMELQVLRTLPWSVLSIDLLQIEASRLVLSENKNYLKTRNKFRRLKLMRLFESTQQKIAAILLRTELYQSKLLGCEKSSRMRSIISVNELSEEQIELIEFLNNRAYTLIGKVGEDLIFLFSNLI